MSAPNADDNDSQTPELGDILTLISSVFGRLTGKIIYRDENTIRVQPFDSNDRAQNIPMGADGDFAKGSGITEVIFHIKRLDPHFSVQLGVAVGEALEFFTYAGEKATESGVVGEIVASEEEDAIILTDGRRLDFAFIGPPSPIDVISVRAQETDEENGEEPPVEYDISFMEHLLPAAMVEEIPTAERTYSESIQREDMYMDLLKDFKQTQQKNPTLLRQVARETELLLALKSSVTSVNNDGKITPFIRSSKTLKDILLRLGSPLSSVIPILAVKRILYSDTEEVGSVESILQQVEFREWVSSELHSYRRWASYAAGQDAGAGARVTNLMYSYLYDILFRDGAVFVPSAKAIIGKEISSDQDVLRTVLPPQPILGYSKIKGVATYANVGPIKIRQTRVISSQKTQDGDVIAAGDPGHALSYIVLPANIGSLWRPVKFSGFLAEDIRANTITSSLEPLESITNNPRSYEKLQVIKNGVDEDSDILISEWIDNNLKQNVHPSDLLSPTSVGVNRVLDSIGLRSYEWTPEIAEIIWSAVKKSQTAFSKAFNVYKDSVEDYIKTNKPFFIGTAIPDDSTIYISKDEIPEIGAALTKLESFDKDFAKWDLAKAQHIICSTEGTLARVLYASTTVGHPHIKALRATYLSEVNRSLLEITAINNSLAKYKAAPLINICPHVKAIEILRSLMMRDESKFLALLQTILNTYQGSRDDNWLNCKACDTHLLCVHELMKFYEKTHPGRAPALNKEILLNFGGAAFNGRYVCRNCGIPIAEFEYDNNLEYDDEGKPLVGRGVVEEGTAPVEDELGQILDMALHKKTVAFDNPIQKQLYDIICVMSLNAGFSLNESTIKKIVEQTYIYETTKIASEDQFNQMYLKKKVKPEYRSYRASLEIALVAAYLICEIHTATPLPELLFPFEGCIFKRGGFPIETQDETEQGALDYFVCVIANLNRDQPPWNLSNWSTEASPVERQKRVRDFILRMFGDPDISVLLKQAQSIYIDNKKLVAENASQNDKISADFRPVYTKVPPVFDETLIIPERLLASAAEAPFDDINSVISNRAHQLAVLGILQAHENAEKTGVVSETSLRSDATCCFMPLADAKSGAMSAFSSISTENEINALRLAEVILHKRDPVEQSNGSHLWVGWSPPTPIPSDPVVPDASYFKMFMRSCFRGSRAGELHEFGRKNVNYECRHCKFSIGMDPLVLMSDLNDEEIYNNNSKRKGPPSTKVQDIARGYLKESGVTVDSATFDNLLSIVSRKQTVAPYVVPIKAESRSIFSILNSLVLKDTPLLPSRMTDWSLVQVVMEANFLRNEMPTEGTRKIAWGPFVTKYDNLKQGLLDILDGRQGRAPVRQIYRKVEDILNSVERITSDPIQQGPSEINKHWVVGLERIATSFSEMVFSGGAWFGIPMNTKKVRNYLFSGTKWFGKKISGRHIAKFETMINGILGFTANTNNELSNPELRGVATTLIQKITTWFGAILTFWSNSIVSLQVYGLTNEELTYILRWLVLGSMESLLTTLSPIYNHITSDSIKMRIQTILLSWTKESLLEAKRQYDLFGLSDIEIEMAILDSREKEKISIIKIIDDEKDPDLRAVIKMQQNLKIGRWGVAAKKSGSYNAEYWDFLQGQRDRMGVVDVAPVGTKDNAVGFDFGAQPEADRRYDTYAAQAEDEE